MVKNKVAHYTLASLKLSRKALMIKTKLLIKGLSNYSIKNIIDNCAMFLIFLQAVYIYIYRMDYQNAPRSSTWD